MAASVTFTPTPEQALAAASIVSPPRWGRHERLRWVVSGVLLGLLALFLVATYNWRIWGLYIIRWQEAASFGFAGGVMGWVYSGRKRTALPVSDPSLRQRTVSIGNDALLVEGRGFRLALDWAVINAVAMSEDIILFVTDWKEAHFVPRQAFSTPEAADAFAAEAQDVWTTRRSGSPESHTGGAQT